jgi:DNA-methyltransferase (dcm)
MRALDLFAGAGGFTQGMKQAGVVTVGAVDSNGSAVDTYNRNHAGTLKDRYYCTHSDIKEIFTLGHHPGGIDLVYGSPPCQGFSTQGKRDPNDHRNDLCWEFARVVNLVRPKYFVMENVEGVSKVIPSLKAIYKEYGYDVLEPWVLNAYDYGVPQNRRRLFLVGHLEGTLTPSKPSPVPHTEKVTAGEALAKLTSSWDADTWTKELALHTPEVERRFDLCPPGTKEPISRFMRVAYGSPAPTVLAASRLIHPIKSRILTPREVACLQSFPDDYYWPTSKVQAYLQIGNAVPPLLGEAVGKAIMQCITHEV